MSQLSNQEFVQNVKFKIVNIELNTQNYILNIYNNLNYDDIIVGCSKCFSGFQFNFETGQCE